MAKEIERKYLVINEQYKEMAYGSSHIIQGYLSTRREATVRVRIRDDKAYLTIKGQNIGIVRDEWEYPILLSDAKDMFEICEGNIIDKTRYLVNYHGQIWEIDEFHGVHQGLVLAEIEMETADSEYPLPPFIGREVSGDNRYYNSVLAGIK